MATGTNGQADRFFDAAAKLVNAAAHAARGPSILVLDLGGVGIETVEKTPDAPAPDIITEVAALAKDARSSVLAASPHRVSVDALKMGQLLGAVERLSAGKVAKPAALDKPSAAASRNDFATATEAAEPAPADPITQAMALIPRTYVEDDNNICAAISNMVNDLDRFRRHVAAANENARKAEGRANDATKRATQAEENLLACRVKIEQLERETRTFPAHVPTKS